jgi:hypothetical protein
VHLNISIGALLRAFTATNAPVFNNDLKRIPSAYGSDRTADHAHWIRTGAAGCRYKVSIDPQPVSDQTGHASMHVCAGSDALVATRAPVQVNQQKVLGVHEPVTQKKIELDVS